MSAPDNREDVSFDEEAVEKGALSPTRIGLLLIHGIGDQPPREHLRNVTESLACAARAEFGPHNVTVTVNSPFDSRGHVTIVAAPPPGYMSGPSNRQGVVIDIREAWWRDLAENPTVGATAKFWWWAMTFCAAPKNIPYDSARLLAPRSKTVQARRVSVATRAAMFAKTTAFFVSLLPVHLAFQLVAIFPLFQRVHFLRTVFAYLNSVRLYQESKSTPARLLENYFECRRLSILRRAAHEAAMFATHKAFDRWYILGHSLGSVVAHNLINLSSQGLARLLPGWRDAVDEHSEFFEPEVLDPDADRLDQNLAAHPSWFPASYGINRDKFFEKLAGVITYGAPLETFAAFWPDIVMTRRHAVFAPEFAWYNLHDPIDLVAGEVQSLPPIGNVAVTNVAVSTHKFFFLAHTAYLSRKPRHHGHRIATGIFRWLIQAEDSLDVAIKKEGVRSPSRLDRTFLTSLLVVQAGLILAVCAMLLPRIVAALGDFLAKIGAGLKKLVVSALTESLHDIDQTCGDSWYCRALHVLSTLGPGGDLIRDCLLSLAVLLFVCFLLMVVSLIGWLLRYFKASASR